MTFEHAVWLWGLVALPLLALLEWRSLRRAVRAVRLLAGERPVERLLEQLRPGARQREVALRLAAVTLLVLGAAGPQWGREAVRRQSQGSDVVFVLDVSASMDTRDVPPSRFDEAKREALALLERLHGSRVAVLAFAGDAVRLCPLTLDQAATRLVLETLGPGAVSTPGSDLGRALRAAVRLFPNGRHEEQAIVVWTDGEDLEGRAVEAIDDLRRAGVRIFTVGAGTRAGDVIPVTDEQGRVTDVKRDENGNVVRSRLDEKLLRDIARASRGAYFSASRPGGELPRLVAALGSLARSSHGSRVIERPVARFGWCAALAALLMAVMLGAPRRNTARAPARRETPVRRAVVAAAALLLLLALVARPAQAQSDWAKADAAFRAGQWAKADSLYARRARLGAPAPVLVNRATVHARAGKRDSSLLALSRLSARDDAAGHAAGYNLGTLHGEAGEIDPALGELRRALERDPDDADARWNYELLKRKREEQRQKDQQKPPKPQPSTPSGGGGGAPPPQPTPPSGGPQSQTPPTNPSAPRPDAQGQPTEMTREQAERLLGSLQELERLEKQRRQRTRVMSDRRGKDW